MNILKMINLKSFLKYKLWIYVLILVIIQTSLNKYMDKKIEARQPDFVYNNSKEFIESLNECISWQERNTTIWQNVPREIIVAQAVIRKCLWY
jgi:hypothetical protein